MPKCKNDSFFVLRGGMFRGIIKRTVLLAMFIAMLSPLWGGTMIARATLRITLYVPPRIESCQMESGRYPGYCVEKNEERVIIIAD